MSDRGTAAQALHTVYGVVLDDAGSTDFYDTAEEALHWADQGEGEAVVITTHTLQATHEARERRVKAEAWNEALRWMRAQADVTSAEYVLDRIDRAETFNPYRATVTVPVEVYVREPGPDVTEVEDERGRIWVRHRTAWWHQTWERTWDEMGGLGPLVPVGTRAALRKAGEGR